MRSWIAPLLLVPTLCLASGQASPDTTVPSSTTTWMTVMLNGRKIGQEEIQRQRAGDVVITTQTLLMDVKRNGRTVPYTNTSRSVETVDGKPLSFGMTTTMSANETDIAGTMQPDGQLQLVTSVGGDTRQIVTGWPAGALLVEGQRMAMLAASQHPGQRYNLLAYNQASQQAMKLDVDVIGTEQVNLLGHVETLNHQRETLRGPRGTQVVDLWLDAQGNLRKGSLSMLGRPLDLVACNQACAAAPSESLDMMDSALIDSPRLLTPDMLSDFLSYRVHVSNKSVIHPFINTDEQTVADLGDGNWQVNVFRSTLDDRDPPTPADTAPNAWLQSDLPAIRELATTAAGNANSPQHVMGNLNSFVNRYLSQQGVDIGYASALEVARDRKGDCVESAVLLAAMARAKGIPARVVIGMIYTNRYGSKSRVFVPHAWVIAWLKDRWHSFDPAATRFDTGHIALDSSDGNPWHLFNATNELGTIQIDSVHTFEELYNRSYSGGMVDGSRR
ncbi:transglutaminase-like domain-containing protein [Dyella acidiphila]|uniref:Transglutaminase domain-containing protein n=1 Tax=Dyella acidiphila TaxID=2775866 RepID=A0ABR9GCB3_9GAMM|nr:transglutaminase-like domain-containing protein [Dyella acidiphila]MBE1161684.1 transglutaminase domain-containing protein [Dyella acidiphila]